MLKELNNTDEVGLFFEELEKGQFSKIKKAQIYGMAYESQQRRKKEEEIEKQVESKYRRIINTTVISDDIAIVEAETKLGDNEINFYPLVEGKFHNESCLTFDEALILALTRKYTMSNQFAPAIYNMLRMDLKK